MKGIGENINKMNKIDISYNTMVVMYWSSTTTI